MAGFPSLTRQATYSFYDSNLQEMGCVYYLATLTAPPSSSASPSADKPLFRLLDSIAAAR